MEERHVAKRQIDYADFILSLGDGILHPNGEGIDHGSTRCATAITATVGLPLMEHYLDGDHGEKLAMEWMYPRNDLADATKKAILAISNERVDHWNAIVQLLNVKPTREMSSHDSFSEVDDPHGFLADMLTETVLNEFTNTQVPPHNIRLKEGDICLIMRPLKSAGLASNSRVKILSIPPGLSPRLIKVMTMEDNPRIVFLPRMRFNFALRYTSSYTLTRVQFPLRLCYAMTINKSQGQSFDTALIDMTMATFSHGHSYVALSRIRHYERIRVMVQPSMTYSYHDYDANIMKEMPLITNIVYPKVIQRLPPP